MSIDTKGLGVVTGIDFRGYGNVYTVRLVDTDFKVELPRERLTIVTETAASEEYERQQTTGPSRFNVVAENDVDDFNYQQTNRNTLSKTAIDLKTLREFLNLTEINELRQMHETSELSSLLCRFLVDLLRRGMIRTLLSIRNASQL